MHDNLNSQINNFVISSIMKEYTFNYFFLGSTEVVVYSAQGSNDPVTSAIHIILGNYSTNSFYYRFCSFIHRTKLRLKHS